MLHFLTAAAISLSLGVPPSLSADSVWVSSADGVVQIDGTANRVIRTLPIDGVSAIAADGAGALWIVTKKDVLKAGTDGGTLFNADLAALGLQALPLVSVDAYDKSVWLADQKSAVHLGADGRRIAVAAIPPATRQIRIGLDETIWLLAGRQLVHLSSAGSSLQTWNLDLEQLSEPKYLIVNDLASSAWIAGEKDLVNVSLNDGRPRANIVLGAVTRALVIEPKKSTVWVLQAEALVAYDSTGALITSVDLARFGIHDANGLAFDPIGGSLWITHPDGVARVSVSGNMLAKIATSRAGDIGVTPFVVLPSLALVRPQNGSVTNSPVPPVVFQNGITCNGEPCETAPSYFATLALTASLNAQSIGNLLVFDAANGQSTYIPPARLPEGVSSLRAQSRDEFGHLSNSIDATFTIDTTPPVFTSISPPDGTVSQAPAVVVTAQINEPGQVVVENLADFAGSAGPASQTTFAFNLTLRPGANEIRLRATDLAGNVSRASLHLSVVSASISIASPSDAAAIDGDSVLVMGAFDGPPRSGITVNEVIAVVDGNHFYAVVPLATGNNSVIATLSTPSGQAVQSTVTVSSTGPSAILVTAEPLTGVAPLTVKVRAVSRAGTSIASSQFTAGGPGATAPNGDPDVLSAFTYTQPGTYQASATITDSAGISSTHPFVFHVEDAAQMDALFQSIWDGMAHALSAGDLQTALNYLNGGARDQYRDVFQTLLPDFARIFTTTSPLQRVDIRERIAEYAINRSIHGENYIFFIYFLRGSDGVWRLDSM